MALTRFIRAFPLPEGASSFIPLAVRLKETGTNKPVILYNAAGDVVTRFGEVKLSDSGEIDTYVEEQEILAADVFDLHTRFNFITYQNLEPAGDSEELLTLYQEVLDDGRAVSPAQSFRTSELGLQVTVSGLILKYRTVYEDLVATINWGDGNTEQVAKDLRSESHAHTYDDPGSYTIQVSPRVDALLGQSVSNLVSVTDLPFEPTENPTILRAPVWNLTDPSVGAVVYLDDVRIEGYTEGEAQDLVGLFGIFGDAPVPLPGVLVDFENIVQFGYGYEANVGLGTVIPAEAEGSPIRLFVAIYDPGYEFFTHVYPVFETTATIGPINATLPPYPLTSQPLVMDTAGLYWSTNIYGDILYAPAGATLAFEWYINDVAQPQVSPFDVYQVTKSALISNGVVAGDEVYCIVTATNGNGDNVRQTVTVTATVENLAE